MTKIINPLHERVVYLGIDQSLRAPGIALVDRDGKVQRSTTIVGHKLTGAARLAYLHDQLLAFVGLGEWPVAGAIEGFSVRSMNRPFDLGEISGVVRAAFYARGLDLLVVPPASLKLFTAGNGNADKDQILYAVKTVWGFETDDDNEADAVALAQFARAAHTQTFTRRCQADAVHQLLKPAAKKRRVRTTNNKNL